MAPCHNGFVRRAGMAIGRRAQQRFVYTPAPPTYTARYRWVGLGGFGMGCQWLAGLVSRVWLCVIWIGGAGGFGDGLPMVSRVSL